MEYSSCKKAFSDKMCVQWDATLLIVFIFLYKLLVVKLKSVS